MTKKEHAVAVTSRALPKDQARKLGRDAMQTGQVAATGSTASAQQGAAGVAAPADAPELSYPAKITLDQAWIGVAGKHEPVQAGMRVSAEIKTVDRKALDYLLSPVMQAVREAGGKDDEQTSYASNS